MLEARLVFINRENLYYPLVKLLLAAFFLSLFAPVPSSLASTPLRSQILSFGRARFVDRPDYLFKLTEALIYNSGFGLGEREAVKKTLSQHGLIRLSSEELYELDAQVRTLLDPYLERYFPDQLNEYNLIFSAEEAPHAWVITSERSDTRPVILVTRGLLDLFDTEEELTAVLLHEEFHHLRVRMSKDAWFERALGEMAEEGRADAFAVRVLSESKRNPQAVAIMLEKLLGKPKATQRRDENESIWGGSERSSWQSTGLGSHPPTEVRITAANALIERLAGRHHFPELTPLKGMLAKVRGAPKGSESPGLKFGTIEGIPLREAYAKIHSADLKILREEFELMRERISQKNLPDWGVVGSWREVAQGLQNAWFQMPLADQVNPEAVALFMQEDLKLGEKVKSLGGVWVSRDRHVAENLLKMGSVQGPEDLLRWAHEFHQIEAGMPKDHHRYSWLWEKYSIQTFSVCNDSKQFERAFEHYIHLAPLIAGWIDRAIAEGALADPQSAAGKLLAAIQDYRDLFMTQFVGWANFKATIIQSKRKPFKQWHQWDSAELNSVIISSFKSWDQKIRSLKIPDHAKAALFPSLHSNYSNRGNRKEKSGSVPEFTWFWDFRGTRDGIIGHITGTPLLPSAQDFFIKPTDHSRDFADFHKAVLFLVALQPQQAPLRFDYSANHGGRGDASFPIDFGGGSKNWVQAAVSCLTLTAQDALDLLAADIYWERRSVAKRDTEDKIKKHSNTALNLAVQMGELSEEDQQRLQAERNAQINSYFSQDNFYNRPEYRFDLDYARRMQLTIYSNLKKNGALPANLADEVSLWTKFSKRGVTSFTDEWAANIIDRLLRLPSDSPNRMALLQGIYYSNLVWDLVSRQRMAMEIFQMENHSAMSTLQTSVALPVPAAQNRFAAWWSRLWAKRPWRKGKSQDFSRQRMIEELLTEIAREFPEDSRERVLVVDRVAERILATREETTYMMSLIGHEPSSIRRFDISKKNGFGVRFYAQLFAEVKGAKLKDRLDLLNFFLGKTDIIPALLQSHYYSHHNTMESPLLGSVAANLELFGPFRLRRSFHSLSVESRTVIIDPLFVGSQGLLTTAEGKNWFIDALVPDGAAWRQLAVDLTEGFVEALQKFGQRHLRTMILSYMLASNITTGRGQYPEFFPATAGAGEGAEDQEGRVLRTLFSATNALMKLGQRLHSSNVLNSRTNDALASLKENAAEVLREDQFQWVEDAMMAGVDQRRVQLGRERGNASVKSVTDATIDGIESVLYLIKPNASLRGDSFFQMIEYAVNYALVRGHKDLRVLLPMIRRARATFQMETDLNHERDAVRVMRSAYSPGPAYGANASYQFISLEYLPHADQVLNSKFAAVARALRTQRFSELDAQAQTGFAQAVAEKEAEILAQDHGQIYFDKDRHEANYLLVTDEKLRGELGLTADQKLILVIDLPQTTRILVEQRDALLDGLAAMTAYSLQAVSLEVASTAMERALRAGILAEQAGADLSELNNSLLRLLPPSQNLSGGAALSRVLSHLEAEGYQIRDEVWDYLTALNTFHTWKRYEESNAVESFLQRAVMERCQVLLGQSE